MKIILALIALIYIIMLYNRFSPNLDIIKKGDRYTILLWYYNLNGVRKFSRVFIQKQL